MIKAGDIAKACKGHFDLENIDRGVLRNLRKLFRDVDFSENRIFETLGIQDANMVTLYTLPIHLDIKLKEPTPFNKIVKLFLLSQEFTHDELVDELFDERELESLISMKILRRKNDLISSSVDIFPCIEHYFATDHHFADMKFSRSVMFLSKDSYTLARGTIRRPVGRSLDLCTGSGVQAILAAGHSEHVVGVDINPRAINFAEFNKIFNEVENVEFREGDLFEAVKDEKFDLIVANPPFVPSPDQKGRIFYRDGGYSGEEILQRILKDLDRYIAPGGLCQIFTNVLFREGEDYIESLYAFLGRRNFDILVLAGDYVPIEVYIIGHLKHSGTFDEYRKKMHDWAHCYQVNRITEIAEGMLIFGPAESGRPGVSRLTKYRIPNRPFWPKVERYFETLRLSSLDREFLSFIPIMNEEIKCFWQGTMRDGKKICVAEFSNDGLPIEERFSPDEAKLLELCSGESSAGEIARIYAQQFKRRRSKTNMFEAGLNALRSLAKKHIIQLGNGCFAAKNTLQRLMLIGLPFLEEIEDIIGVQLSLLCDGETGLLSTISSFF